MKASATIMLLILILAAVAWNTGRLQKIIAASMGKGPAQAPAQAPARAPGRSATG